MVINHVTIVLGAHPPRTNQPFAVEPLNAWQIGSTTSSVSPTSDLASGIVASKVGGWEVLLVVAPEQ